MPGQVTFPMQHDMKLSDFPTSGVGTAEMLPYSSSVFFLIFR